MKITMYELLGMIKDGKAPKKIKYNTFELKQTMSNNLLRMYVDEEGMFFPEYYSGLTLNDEVEILEEEPRDIEVCGSLFTKSEYDKLACCEEEKKIPEKLYKYMEKEEEGCYENILRVYDGGEYEINEDMSFVIDKINSIIDYLKSKGE